MIAMDGVDPRHRLYTARLLCESVLGAVLLGAAAVWIDGEDGPAAGAGLVALVLAQGCWLHRLYVVAHEASHRKLWPTSPVINDVLGQLLLLPLMLPLRIHRKIHAFHHGHNRRDVETSALDTFVIRRPRTALGRGLSRAWCRLLWYAAVFAGGFFLHSLVSVVLFLAMPMPIARRISPAFKGWKLEDQLRSLLSFGLGLGLHLGVASLLGPRVWALTLGWPLLAFAWVYSLLVYIYHYDTDYGPAVRFHVRGLRRQPLAAWWLLNFNEHATHHRLPKLPWYALPDHREPLPPEHADNQKVETILAAIALQLRGPRILERPPSAAPKKDPR
ncbi:Fatty acid desaturase [Enhygromyxa salina]|uniref:Fatty acid desaturase n=2 Tax=Enhygromyxa salina TaxID=215803 RepID=A0A2S9XAU1_9BACT|nr:Fatty acid desaturase [Enhygromyxa salina]